MIQFDISLMIIIILLLYSCVVSYYCYKFALILIKLEDTIDASLDALDQIHKSFIEILEIPVFFDSLEIRKCIDLIKRSKNIIQDIIFNISDIPLVEISGNFKKDEKINTEENKDSITYEGKEKDDKK